MLIASPRRKAYKSMTSTYLTLLSRRVRWGEFKEGINCINNIVNPTLEHNTLDCHWSVLQVVHLQSKGEIRPNMYAGVTANTLFKFNHEWVCGNETGRGRWMCHLW